MTSWYQQSLALRKGLEATSGVGSTQRDQCPTEIVFSALPLIADSAAALRYHISRTTQAAIACTMRPIQHAMCHSSRPSHCSFEQFVGPNEHRQWWFEPQRLGGPQVDKEFDPRRL